MTVQQDAATSTRTAQEISETVTITNRRGLHARAAAKLVKTAGQYDAEIEVIRNDVVVSADSIMGLMMLAAGPGTPITLRAFGNEAEAAMVALVDLIGRKFDED